MKTLKFMLAAATAIGIASAAQAAQNKEASTGFEKLAIGDKVYTGVPDNDANKSYFYYAGETAEDNESEIVAFVDNDVAVARPTGVSLFSGADATARANALQVSTGADPLLRTFKQLSNSAPQAGETFTATTYIDTLVQFTVTPSNDTVTVGTDDKLMIYLREVAPVFGEDGSVTTDGKTNLVVKAGYLMSDYAVEATEFALNASVEPGTWYRLTVVAIPDVLGELASGSIGFRIMLNGAYDNPLKTDAGTYDASSDELVAVIAENKKVGAGLVDGTVFLSLQTAKVDNSTLQAVGFAGEGLVDDLVITTNDPSKNVVNFTLTLGENVSGVEYTVNGETQLFTKVEEVVEGATIAISSVTYATGYEYDTYTSTGLTTVNAFDGSAGSFTVNGTEAASLTINAKAATPTVVTPDGAGVTVNSENAANAITISATSPDSTIISNDNYAKYFKKVITDNKDGTYTVTAVLDEYVVDADATAAELAGKFDEIINGEVSVTAKPGLYYSVNQGSALDGMTEGDRVMAGSDGTVSLKATKYDGAGFYQIMVNFADKAAE